MLRTESGFISGNHYCPDHTKGKAQCYQDLLDAAQHLYYELPWDSVSIERAALKSGIPSQQAYKLLTDSSDLLKGVIKRGIGRLQSVLYFHVQSQTDVPDRAARAQKLLDAGVMAVLDDISFWKLYFFASRDENMRDVLAQQLQEFDIFLNLQMISAFRYLQTHSPEDDAMNFRTSLRTLITESLYTPSQSMLPVKAEKLLNQFI